MPYRFVNQPLQSGLYEPEGIYLNPPVGATGWLLQRWGEHSEYYAQFTYNGIPLNGHTGLDFAVPAHSSVFAVDHGRVVEISYEPGGFERYLKLEHRWGESLYAFVGRVPVDSGQIVERGAEIAQMGGPTLDPAFGPSGQDEHAATDEIWAAGSTLFHFAVRIAPFNRFDGYGGFTDPLPYLNPGDIVIPDAPRAYQPHPMPVEKPAMRRA